MENEDFLEDMFFGKERNKERKKKRRKPGK